MNAYHVVFDIDNGECDEWSVIPAPTKRTYDLVVIAPSRGKARVFVVREFELDEFTYPMSIRLIEKGIPVELDYETYAEYAGYAYERVDGKWVRTDIETEEEPEPETRDAFFEALREAWSDVKNERTHILRDFTDFFKDELGEE